MSSDTTYDSNFENNLNRKDPFDIDTLTLKDLENDMFDEQHQLKFSEKY